MGDIVHHGSVTHHWALDVAVWYTESTLRCSQATGLTVCAYNNGWYIRVDVTCWPLQAFYHASTVCMLYGS